MEDKRTTLAEAAAQVAAGQVLALGGMTLYRRPLAFARQLALQPDPPHGLTLLAFTSGLEGDLLVGAGLVTRTRTCYFGLETFGLAPMFTAAVHEQRLTIVEESEASIANGLRAALAGIGFMPGRGWQGSDMFRVRPDVKTIADPYTGETLTAFPAIHCDVAIIHVLRADRQGNAILGGNPTIDLELAAVARTVILTAEEVVDELPGEIDIPGLVVDHVVASPYGAWPTSCHPRYAVDGLAIMDYIAACQQGAFTAYLEQSHVAYSRL